MNVKPLSIIILAAGKGTRMKSSKAKVIHPVFYQPMAAHVIANAKTLNPLQTIVVIGHQKEIVQDTLSSFSCDFVVQTEQHGTAHAVLATAGTLIEDSETVLILCGDTPLILPETLENFYTFHKENNNDLSLLTTTLINPFGYGRILCNEQGDIQAIIEEKDTTTEQKAIIDINAGIYCVKKNFLFSALEKVNTNNIQKEMYLTDIIEIGVKEGKKIQHFKINNSIEVLGINSRQELAEAERELLMRHNRNLMAAGVSMISPETVRISPEATISPDVTIEPSVHITGNSNISSGCYIEQGVILKECHLGCDVVVGAGSYLVHTSLPDNTTISPHTCLI